MKNTEKILLIDGNNSLTNNFFGVKKELRDKFEKTNTPLTLHISTTLQRWINVIKEENYKKVIVVFDSKEKTIYKKNIYTDYKKKSEKKPLLDQSILPTKQILSCLGIYNLSVPGHESDDVISSIIQNYKHTNFHIDVWSDDKDLYQLVNEKVSIVQYNKKSKKLKTININDVEDEMGLTPKEYLEYKFLFGDKSNCVPGIPFLFRIDIVKSLIKKYKTIENLLESNSDFSKEEKDIIKTISNYKDIYALNKELVTLISDIKYRNYINNTSYNLNKLYALCKENKISYNTTNSLMNYVSDKRKK